MEETLTFEGKIFISSKRAARIAGYTTDYVGQLCRSGKVNAKLVGRNWYVEENSIKSHKLESRSTGKPSQKDNNKINLADTGRFNGEEFGENIVNENKDTVPVYRPVYPYGVHYDTKTEDTNDKKKLTEEYQEESDVMSDQDPKNPISMNIVGADNIIVNNEQIHKIPIMKNTERRTDNFTALGEHTSMQYSNERVAARTQDLSDSNRALAVRKQNSLQTKEPLNRDISYLWAVVFSLVLIFCTITALILLKGEVSYIR